MDAVEINGAVRKMERLIQEQKLVLPGHRSCPGCAGPILQRIVFNVLGKNVIQYGRGGCGTPSVLGYPMIYTTHSSAGSDGAAGILAALRAKGIEDVYVVGLAGDGAAADTGFGKISACAQRNEDMFLFVYDNEAFMNTGVQQSRLTPFMAWTRTTPGGKKQEKKDIGMIIAQHHVPYVSSLSISHIPDLTRKVRKGMKIKGFKFYHSLNPCPTGWNYPSSNTVEMARLAVQTWYWPLYEIENGVFRLTVKSDKKPIDAYFEKQRRYSHLTEKQIEEIQGIIDRKRERMLEMDGKSVWF